MCRRRVDGLALAGRGPVAQAVVRRAQVRAALDHPARDRRREVAAWLRDDRVARNGRAARRCRLTGAGARMARPEEVTRPLPDVAGHVKQAIPVGRERAGRRGALVAIEREVLPWELTLPGVGQVPAIGREIVTPDIDRAVEAAASGEFPLRLGRQRLARPRRVGLRVGIRNVRDRVPVPAPDVAGRALGTPPARAGNVRPPLAEVAEIDRPGGAAEDQRARYQQAGVGIRVVGGAERPLGDRPVTGRGHKPAEVGYRDRPGVHPEAVHGDPAHGALLRIEGVRPHGELAAGDPGHACPPGGTGAVRHRRRGPHRGRPYPGNAGRIHPPRVMRPQVRKGTG